MNARRGIGAARLVAPSLALAVLALPVGGAALARVTMAPKTGTSKSVAAKPAPDSLWFKEIVKTLAVPRWEGRGIGTAGIDSAADYIAGRMMSLGLAPAFAGEGGYFQPFEVTTGVTVGDPCAVSVGPVSVSAGGEMQPLGFSTNGTLRAGVVFAGYGISAPGYEYDDYAGIDVHDRLVLVLTQEPGEMDSTSRFDGNVNTPYAELRTKAINAREHGALGLLVVNGPRYHAGEPLRPPRTEGAGYMSSGLLAATISERVAGEILKPAGLTLAAAQEAIESRAQPHSLALPESVTITVTLKRTRASTRNVAGMVHGRDTTRTLVVGAHYDHLGMGGEGSLAPDSHVAHVGADDNASGVSAVLGVARSVEARMKSGWRPEHNLLFCAFTGEESGLLGSSHLVDDPPVPLETVETMLNMDMVGRLRDDKLMVMGVGTSAAFPALVVNVNDARAAGQTFVIKTSSDGYGPSDHSSFYKRQVPVLMLFTGAHPDYHKPSDTWDKIYADGIARISDFATALVESLDARPRSPYRKAEADSSVGRIAGGGGYGAYLGTIPDYMQTEGGVLLSGVRAGGPAATAGIQGGDVIVKFDGIRIDNIYDYTYALRSRKPGQQVRITFKRKDAEQDVLVTLGRRP
ncbi:MAG TPA: M28 family peptidase [Candidatus Sulfotelmatobacter sp.]|nr:M28 family peptidase [Candidatus Sulfotelmatobacter sp.]